MLPLVARFPLFECPFELLEALFVVVEPRASCSRSMLSSAGSSGFWWFN
jgi:hypothetical protein